MDQKTISVMFALVQSAFFDRELSETEKNLFSDDMVKDLLSLSKKHDISHLLAHGLSKNALIQNEDAVTGYAVLKAVYRYEQLNYELKNVCEYLESAKIPFIPLKGAIIRKYYPEPWMRTSCDIDILVHREDLDAAISCLVEQHGYEEKERATHDVSLYSPGGQHIELHFDLVEEGRANRANEVLKTVWENVSLRESCGYWYEMSDAFYYFYHIAHMAKHFECGGCGIRPFIDLWILDHIEGADREARDALLQRGDLLKFTNAARKLSQIWMQNEPMDELSQKIQAFIFHGGVYGSADNRVVLQQRKKGGRIGYIFSRMFIPYHKLKRYYPVLEKHKWLMPIMQIRRWFMLLNPSVAKMAKKELATNARVEKTKADEMKDFLDEIGIE